MASGICRRLLSLPPYSALSRGFLFSLLWVRNAQDRVGRIAHHRSAGERRDHRHHQKSFLNEKHVRFTSHCHSHPPYTFHKNQDQSAASDGSARNFLMMSAFLLKANVRQCKSDAGSIFYLQRFLTIYSENRSRGPRHQMARIPL